jgi:hypothetical protein
MINQFKTSFMKKITFIAAIFLSALSFAQIAGTSFEEPGTFAAVNILILEIRILHTIW